MGLCASKSVLAPDKDGESLLQHTQGLGLDFWVRHHRSTTFQKPYIAAETLGQTSPGGDLLEREDTVWSEDTAASTEYGDEHWAEDVSKRYELRSVLGVGGTSSVHLAVDKMTGAQVAIKVQKRPIKEMHVSSLYNEILVGSQSWLRKSFPSGGLVKDCSFLCHSKGVFLTKHCYGIVMEAAMGGNLANYVCSTVGKHVDGRGNKTVTAIGEEQAKFIFKQLVLGLQHMERNMHCVHRDIKLDNICIMSDSWKKERKNKPGGKYHCVGKVAYVDFQFATVVDDDGVTEFSGLLGTPVYMAPELLALKFGGVRDSQRADAVEYDASKADIWALGVTLVVMLVAGFPYDDVKPQTMEELEKSIYRLQQSQSWRRAKCVRPFLPYISKDCLNLIDGLLEFDPVKRLTVDQILQHPWMTKEFESKTMRRAWEGIMSEEEARGRQTQICLTKDVREEEKAAILTKLEARNAAIKEMLLISTSTYDRNYSVLKRVRTEDQLERLKAHLEVFSRPEIADLIDRRTFEHNHSLEIDLDMNKIYGVDGSHEKFAQR